MAEKSLINQNDEPPEGGDLPVKKLKKIHAEMLMTHNQMLDHFRSIDQIVKEGSDPSSSSRFTSSSSRDPDTK